MTSITGSDFTNMGTVWKLISRLPGMYQEWWLNLYHESPQHIVIETGLLLFIIWLLFIRRTVDPNQTKKNEKLSSKEVEWLIDTWKPEPLAEPLDQRSQQMLDSIVVSTMQH
jgi:serine palmitoyltransferase